MGSADSVKAVAVLHLVAHDPEPEVIGPELVDVVCECRPHGSADPPTLKQHVPLVAEDVAHQIDGAAQDGLRVPAARERQWHRRVQSWRHLWHGGILRPE